ncbi:MAG TPA: hypothetical protein VL947_00445, partial [Cytophagales bacterium]|nr:hypothetical protein [Cytophagales bacterium]
MHRLLKTIVWLSITVTSSLNAQNSPKFGDDFKVFAIDEGFSCENVRQIVQDNTGFIWLASNSGLYRFDGNHFELAKNTDQRIQRCLESDILNIYIDKMHRMWVGSQKGLVVYDPLTDSFSMVQFSQNDISYVHSIVQAPDGAIWISCNYGVYVVDNQYNAVPLYKENNTRHSLAIILSDFNKKSLWLVNYSTVTKVNYTKRSEEFSFRYSSDNSQEENFQTTANIDHQGQLWIGKYNGEVYKIQPLLKQIDKYDFKQIAKSSFAIINYIYCDGLGKIWIAVDETGILSYNPHKNSFEAELTTKQQQHNLPTYKITTLFKDRESNLWFHMKNTGLVLYNPSMSKFGKFQIDA